ncbi:crotonase/enoyl-CoA hydratase family protein [Rhodococcus qingshengii]|uniref:crotonase/enoyl-CoA hydratase family protein n=1 Tax=Rhodococcus qingshengii TaxID=334542 RepID=UPI0010A63BFD|nr:crotonase/enoyl-CoA hydratase family protein [Rhodococcus qingshengii]THJ67679.1 crotonase/enoyl-CoA hydratase family protein [Rhodococcus qingshengii]
MTQSTTGGIVISRSGHIATISINRPAVRNAIDLPTALNLESALDEIEADNDIRVIVLTGTASMFSAGMDLKAFAATGERPITTGRGAFGIVGRPPSKPTIAAVEGHALGGGFEIALAADLIVAGESATFGLPEVKRGLVAAAGGLMRLPTRIPVNIALQAALSGEPISAAEGRSFGLVNKIASDGSALAGAVELAASIARNAPLALRVSKEIIYRSADWSVDDMFERQSPLTAVVRESNDASEGARAFVEKREPIWSGQ